MSRVRLGLAIIGFVLALGGVVLNDARLVWAAIAVLAGSAIARLVSRKRDNASSDGNSRV
jgi:hypothetical protein